MKIMESLASLVREMEAHGYPSKITIQLPLLKLYRLQAEISSDANRYSTESCYYKGEDFWISIDGSSTVKFVRDKQETIERTKAEINKKHEEIQELMKTIQMLEEV